MFGAIRDGHMHFEACKGSADENRIYCQKGGDFVEYGTFKDIAGK